MPPRGRFSSIHLSAVLRGPRGARDVVFNTPQHPHAKTLLSATPHADPARKRERIVLNGELPSLLNPPSGCTFHLRRP